MGSEILRSRLQDDNDEIMMTLDGRFRSSRLGKLTLLNRSTCGYQCKYTMRYDQTVLFLMNHIHKNSIFHACVFVS